MLMIWLHLGILNIFPTILLLISNRKYKTQFGSQYINGFEEMKSTGNSLILQQKIYVGVVFTRILVFVALSVCYVFDLAPVGAISSLNITVSIDEEQKKLIAGLLFIPSFIFQSYLLKKYNDVRLSVVDETIGLLFSDSLSDGF